MNPLLNPHHARVEERVGPSKGNGTQYQLLKKLTLNSTKCQLFESVDIYAFEGLYPLQDSGVLPGESSPRARESEARGGPLGPSGSSGEYFP